MQHHATDRSTCVVSPSDNISHAHCFAVCWQYSAALFKFLFVASVILTNLFGGDDLTVKERLLFDYIFLTQITGTPPPVSVCKCVCVSVYVYVYLCMDVLVCLWLYGYDIISSLSN